MLRNVCALVAIGLAGMIAGCSGNTDTNHTAAPRGTSVTLYSSATELFMEYPPLVVGTQAKFLLHFTDLKDFKPVTKGSLTVEFRTPSGEVVRVAESEPARPGIYTPLVKFNSPGTYAMTMDLSGPQVTDHIILGDITVAGSAAEVPPAKEAVGPAPITFLKEQQWKISFATAPVVKRNLHASVSATGEILAKPELFANVVSPVAGILLPRNNTGIPSPGSWVKKGDVLYTISPSADASANFHRVRNDYFLAKSEFERVEGMYEKKAVARKRYDEARFDFESKQASFTALEDQIKLTSSGYAIVAPIDGFVESMSVSLGSQISSGQELLSIINPRQLILKANVPASKFEDAHNSTDASFRIEGYEAELRISSLNGRKVSVGSSLSGESRSVPVYFEFTNPQNKVKVGMYAQVSLVTGSGQEALAIPESAIVDEDALHTVYVQVEGEAFEKRIITTKLADGGFVQVLQGLREGERVVTRGAYQVRLAALSPESAIGQGHVH